MVKNRCAVWFRSEEKAIFTEMSQEGLILRSFPDFVRSVFYDRLEKIKLENKKLQSKVTEFEKGK